jgi:DNA-binding response OmpR family regulator
MKKILVIDDDLDILTLVKMTLKMNGFAVEAISRWQEIDNKIQEDKPDLIILDISLGSADGREICMHLKEANDTKDIPIILFSAHADMGESIQSCKAQAFIAKPYELSHFLRTIKTFVN